MASSKLQSAMEEQGDDARMDMSPMIDMVFLLLIFFMVASRMVTVKVDDKIKPPVADESIGPTMLKVESFLISDLTEPLLQGTVRSLLLKTKLQRE